MNNEITVRFGICDIQSNQCDQLKLVAKYCILVVSFSN